MSNSPVAFTTINPSLFDISSTEDDRSFKFTNPYKLDTSRYQYFCHGEYHKKSYWITDPELGKLYYGKIYANSVGDMGVVSHFKYKDYNITSSIDLLLAGECLLSYMSSNDVIDVSNWAHIMFDNYLTHYPHMRVLGDLKELSYTPKF